MTAHPATSFPESVGVRASVMTPELARSVCPVLFDILADARARQASDVRVVPDVSVRLQVDGDRSRLSAIVSDDEVQAFVSATATPTQARWLRERHSVDFSTSASAFGRLRINAAQTRRGLVLSMRFLPDTVYPFDQQDLPSIIAQWVHRPHGVLFFTGSTGSGKSSLQATLVDVALDQLDPVVWMLEDPIEYVFDDDRVSQRELGEHMQSLAGGIEDVLRQNPDIIVIGEVRSRATAEAMLAAAESGHLVLATGHCNEPAAIIERITAFFAAEERDLVRLQLSSLLIGVVGMHLVKRAPEKGGGRRVACEIFVNDDTVALAIKRGADLKSLRDLLTNGGIKGMLPLEKHLLDLYRRQEVSWKTVQATAVHPDRLQGKAQ